MLGVKLFFHKLFHWEYWPYQVVYFPVYFLYLYCAFRAKSFFFFNASNPTIKNGGFFMESKKEIYDLIPQQYYPKTILVANKSHLDTILKQVEEVNLHFPIIAKPDIGLRGTAVKKLHSKQELENYSAKANFDFLLQELIPYSNEIGLFYVKLPNEKAKITGIVGKEFLIVTGDGKSSIRQLLHQDKRYLLQLKSLESEYKEKLETVLEKGKSFNLVPYGNHCRGSKFLDFSKNITPKLTQSFAEICNEIDGFYYGRMDIMYNNFEDLENKINFQIVEINGAISEPTHIYDPSHSLFFGWKELVRHFYYMYKISKANHKSGHRYLTFNEGIREFKNHHNHYDAILEF